MPQASNPVNKPDIVVIAKALGCLPEKKQGSKFVGECCPANHNSKGKRVFWIYPGTQSYYCWNCKRGGDAFDLIEFARNCTFPDAKQWATEQGLVSDNGHQSARQQTHPDTKPAYMPPIETDESRQLFQILTDAANFFHQALPDSYRDHLRQHYGLTDDIIDEHRLGFAPTDAGALVKHLKKTHTLEIIKKTGLLTKKGESWFQGQIVFPYWCQGLTKYVIARQTADSPGWKQGKYDKLPVHNEDRPYISPDIQNAYFYGEDSITGADTIFVAEGVTDCLAALQHALPCISPVTTSFKESDWPKLISLTAGKKVVLVPDNETNSAGLLGAEKTESHLESAGIPCHIVLLPRPEGEDKIDLNEYLRDHGIEAFLKLAQEQRPKTLADAFLEIDDFIAIDFPVRPAIILPWLTQQSIGMISGYRGVGKSGFALGALLAVAKGSSFGPWKVETQVNSAYLDGEMVQTDVLKRLTDFGTGGRTSSIFIYCDSHAHSIGIPKASLLNEKWRDAFTGLMVQHEVKLCVIDNISSLCPGIDENSKESWDPINQFFLQLRFKGISTILLHHEGKTGNQRGTSGREDNLDYSISLKRPGDYVIEDGARFISKFTKARIPNEHLTLIADLEFKLVTTLGDCVEWSWCDVRSSNKTKILQLSDEGLTVTEIATTIGIDKAHVSRVRKRAIEEGLLTKGGKLTQFGFKRSFDG